VYKVMFYSLCITEGKVGSPTPHNAEDTKCTDTKPEANETQ